MKSTTWQTASAAPCGKRSSSICPSEVQVASLSATVSNAEEFGAWLDTVRGQTDVIVSEHRPVPLWQHVMVGRKIVDLFAGDTTFDEIAPAVGTEVPAVAAATDKAGTGAVITDAPASR